MSTHRLPPPPSALRGRIVIAAVAVGAFAAAGAGQTLQAVGAGSSTEADEVTPLANTSDGAAAFGVGGNNAGPAAPQVLPVAKLVDPSAEASKLAKSQRITEKREAAEAEAKRPKVVRPAPGVFTSGYGGRWGEMHYGIDIAGPIGDPIYAAADGVVIEAGPASGFGLWVKIEHADGTVTVYGHMDTFSVQKGQQVTAGEQIARVGNRGFSTGPHLHFEVWNPSGMKINPLPWLNERGVTL
ncbi:M23 family metallopeptidase [Umezawaea tangerina]|uniref:M23 family metallopeptidase n=1 Tax=Umezawaea tangerina TaxID=84725 RepID=UPI001FE32C16|nr:M23 family metallopeptidase [Umezawaea tangerina]